MSDVGVPLQVQAEQTITPWEVEAGDEGIDYDKSCEAGYAVGIEFEKSYEK